VSGPRALVYRLLSVALFLAAWVVASRSVPPQFFPGPERVLATVGGLLVDEATYQHLTVTIMRIAVGFVLSMLLGSAIGIAMGARRRAEAFFEVWVMVGLTVPAPAAAMLAVMLLGLSETAGAVAITVLVTPFVAVNVWQGVKAMDPGLVEMARVFALSRRALLREVVVPQLVPFLLAAARYGFGLTWKVVVIIEMIALGDGVGHALTSAFRSFEMYTVLAWTLIFAALMLLVETAIRLIERRATAWRPHAGADRYGAPVVDVGS
jgi:NitT/TauT family transport system permease protein